MNQRPITELFSSLFLLKAIATLLER